MASKHKAVLVMDDEPMVRFVAASLFEDMGFEVLEAEDGQEALEILARRPDLTLIFTDCRMPGLQGPDLARLASKLHPHIRVVLVSGYLGTADKGAWPFLAKPYTGAELARVVARELDA